ncbi:MAG: twin-arginine translocation signal domain-containing protein, partial [Anaerolineae bacterium]|nr:twin-arginine translocation signal domain-containing protein [Anaerolineae bacterium]
MSDHKKYWSRREFLKRTAAAGATATLGPLSFTTVRTLAAPRQQKTTLRVVSGQDVTEIEVREQIAKMYQEINPDVEIEIMLITGTRDESQTIMM